MSGWTGENLVKKSENMPWYKGKTLLETFDEFKVPEKPTGKPLRLPIQDVYSITGVGTVPVGRVETGSMKPNDKIIVMPSGATGEIKSIETHHTEMPSASAGDNIGFNLRGIEKKDIKRGDVLGTPDKPPNGCQGIQGTNYCNTSSNGNCSWIHTSYALSYYSGCCNDISL